MKIAIVLGTRPEVIKIAPIIFELKKANIKPMVINTGQHRQMLDQTLKIFKIKPDYDLNIMIQNQTLSTISMKVLQKIGQIFEKEKPDLILVQGDTTTTLISSLAAFYQRIPIGHIEAGLRTYNKYNPFPEEINRQLIDIMADFYFAPTFENKQNLLCEGRPKEKIFVTGNTAIDALFYIAKKNYKFKNKTLNKIDFKNKKVILLTCHRREVFGKKIESIFKGIKKIANEFENVKIIYPVHLNPNVQKPAEKILSKHPRIHLIKPIIYSDMARLLKNCYLIVTDSGGLQEEAPTFNKPVLVLRDETERTEGIKAGTLKLVGTDEKRIYLGIKKLLNNKKEYQSIARAKNPYGDGKASQKIVRIINNLARGVIYKSYILH